MYLEYLVDGDKVLFHRAPGFAVISLKINATTKYVMFDVNSLRVNQKKSQCTAN